MLGIEDATSTEFDADAANPAVIFMPEISKTHLGGTMRLGSRPTIFQVEDCVTKRLYGGHDSVDERHRHRYEINPDLVDQIEAAGLKFVGKVRTKADSVVKSLNSMDIRTTLASSIIQSSSLAQVVQAHRSSVCFSLQAGNRCLKHPTLESLELFDSLATI